MAERSTNEQGFRQSPGQAVRDKEATKAPAFRLSLYFLLILAILGVGFLVRTMGVTPLVFSAAFDGGTVVHDRFGTEIAQFHPEDNMVPVTLEGMSPILVDAVLVALDAQYLERTRIEPWPLFAIVLAPTSPNTSPTITQRFVRLVNGSASTRVAALREAAIVVHLERTVPRAALLEQYLSQVPLGRLTFGVEAASLAWYGRSASDLEIGQAAHLASLMVGVGVKKESPAGRDQILALLYEAGLITRDELVVQRTIPMGNLLISNPNEAAVKTLVPGAGLEPFLEEIYGQVVERNGPEPVLKGQIEVGSTLDLGAQQAIAAIVEQVAEESGIAEIVVVVLDDRNHVRVMYQTGHSLAQQARIESAEVLKPFRRWESFGETLNWPNRITALELAQGHALVGRGGRSYETQVILEIRDTDDGEFERVYDQELVSFDAGTVQQVKEYLTECVGRGSGFGAHLDEVVVAGCPGANSVGDLAWFGGFSARFSVGLWMNFASLNASDPDANRAAAARLAGEVLRELHRYG